ncbi:MULTISPECIES: PspA/IM30 family protein [Aquabacterium]|uniref:PspA/IM30 family protein n=1 Tax=Aquabacterium TaxID=92793 RepID=UPI000718D083|nr:MULTISPECIES: PspA/IM30 family protein [Aquabacterium]MBU0916721.1 PspA/IM30 family protein [Gammaproteobacteria bacterium]
MANHQIAARLWNLVSGFVALFVTNVEKEHPEIAYQNAIQSMTEKYGKLKAATGRIIARRMDLEQQMATAQSELSKVQSQLNAALATNQDDLALVLLQKKNALEEQITDLTSDLAEAQKDAEEAKDSLLEIKSEIDRLKAEKERMLAKFQSAEARIKIQESLDGLSIDAEVQALAGVREHIKGRVAEAKLGNELRSSDLDTRLAALNRSAGAVNARAQLDALKKERANAAAVGSKTL